MLSNATNFLQKLLDKAENEYEETVKTALTLQKGNKLKVKRQTTIFFPQLL